MTRRSWRRGSWTAAGAVLAAVMAGACSREPAFLIRTFEPGEQAAGAPAVTAELTQLAYGRELLRARVELTNRSAQALHVDGSLATVELEGLHYPALDGEPLTVSAGSRATLVVEVNLGRRLHVPATLVLHGVAVGSTPGDPLVMELPAAPHPAGDQSGTGP